MQCLGDMTKFDVLTKTLFSSVSAVYIYSYKFPIRENICLCTIYRCIDV